MTHRRGLGLGLVLVSMAACGAAANHPLPVDASGNADSAVDKTAADMDLGSADADANRADANVDVDVDVDVDQRQPPPDAAAVKIWSDASTAIDVRCSGFHEGLMRFRARRDQLTAGELGLLANVTTTQLSPPDACTPDVLSCSIAITDGSGTTATYVAFAFDYICGAHDNLVADSTFRPFRQALPCRYGREVGPGLPPGPALAPDERCFNGFISGVSLAFPDPLLSVDSAGRSLHVELDGCTSPSVATAIAMQILTEDGATTVAEGAPVATPGPDQICLSVDHTFAAPGNYRLHIGAAGDGGAGLPWLFYRFY